MPRYIDAEKIKYFEHTICCGHGDYRTVRDVSEDKINAIPTADVVEVVRCKECRNFGEDVGMSKDGVWARCYLHKRIMCEKDFCSYGEKMDGKGESNA